MQNKRVSLCWRYPLALELNVLVLAFVFARVGSPRSREAPFEKLQRG